MRRKIAILFSTLILLAVTAHSGEQPKWGKVSDSEWALTSVAEYPDANAVILFDKGILEVTTEGISFYKHVRIKVFNEAGAEEAGDVTFSYWDIDNIKELKAHTIAPDGAKYEVNGKDIKVQEYDETRSRAFSFPQVAPGVILEYSYRNYNKRFNNLDPWHFHNKLYTLYSEIALKLFPGFIYSTAYNNMPPMFQEAVEAFDISTSVKTFTWKMTKLPPLRDEPYQGAEYNYRSALICQMVRYEDVWSKVEFVSDWPDLGSVFEENVIEKYVGGGKGLSELAEKLSAGQATSEDKAIAIYQYVRDSIRIMAEATGYFPHEKIELLLTEKVGTSDEKNLLLVELFKRAGIKAWPALISTRDHGIFNNQIYQLRQFNQLIAVAETDKGGVLLDATSRYCPYGVLSPNCLVKGGLLIDGKKSRPINIKPMPPKSFRVDRTNIKIDDSGLVRCSTHTTLKGYFTVNYGEKYETTEGEDFIKDILMTELKEDYELLTHHVTVAPDSQKMDVFITFTSPKLAESLDGNLFMGQPVFNFDSNPFALEKRFFPIDFTYPAFYHNVITYDIDSGYSVSELPKEIILNASKLEFQRLSFINDDKVVVESKLLIGEALIAPELYTGVRNLFAEMERSNREQVVFVPKK